MILNKLLIKVIRLYQICLSPYLPNVCKFEPSCSSYCIQAFIKFSFLNAIFISTKRILRCSPLSKGGFDPLP